MTIRDIAVAFGVEQDKASFKKAENSIKSLKSFATKALGMLAIGFSLKSLRQTAEEFNGINDKIRDATRGMGEQSEIQKTILSYANDARQSYGDMADTVSKFAQNTDVFGSVDDAAQFSGLLYKNFMAAGKSASESNSLVKQMTTSISKGVVDSRAMMTLFRESPATLRMMADSMGVSIEKLQEMVSKGQVSAKTLKDVFEKNAGSIESRFGEVDLTITDAILNIRNQWGLFVDETNSTFKLTQKIAKAMVKGFTKVLTVLRKLRDGFIKIANKIGGVERVLKLLAISAGAIFIALNASKILGFLKGFASGVGKVNAKMLAIVAVVVLVALLVEDLINFMQGNDSLIGEIFKKAGIDGDEMRAAIQGILDAAKAMIPFLVDGLKSLLPFLMDIAKTLLPFIIDLIKKLLPFVIEIIKKVLPVIINLIKKLLPVAMDIVKKVLAVLINQIDKFLPLIMEVIDKVLPLIISLIERLLPVVMEIIEAVLPVLITLVEAWITVMSQIYEAVLPIVISLIEVLIDAVMPIIDMILPLLMSLLETVMPIITAVAELLGNVLGTAFEALMPIIDAVMGIFQGLIDFITGVFTGDWRKAWDAIVSIFKNIIDGIVAIFKLPINLIIDGLNFFIRGLNKIKVPDWVPGIGGKGINIDEIPHLAQGGYVGANDPQVAVVGDNKSEGEIIAPESKIFKTVMDALWSFASSARPQASTVAATTSAVENKSIIQNVHFSNQFNGDRAAQKNLSTAMDSAADDVTGQLARALAYAR